MKRTWEENKTLEIPMTFKIDNGDTFSDSFWLVALFCLMFWVFDVEEISDDDVEDLGIFGTNRMTIIILMKDPNALTKAADCSLK